MCYWLRPPPGKKEVIEMDENTINEGPAQADGAKPRRHWRVNRARIGVLAAVLGIIGAFLLLAVVAPPTVQAATWEQAVLAGASSGAAIGIVGGSVVPGLGTAVGFLTCTLIGGTCGLIGWYLGGGDSSGSANAAEMGKSLATEQYEAMNDKMLLAQTNAMNVKELSELSGTYYQRACYNAAVALYQDQTLNDQPHLYDSDYILDRSMLSDQSVGSTAGTYVAYNRVLAQLDVVGANYVGDYKANSVAIGLNSKYINLGSSITYDSTYYVRMVNFCTTGADQYVWLNNTDNLIMWNLGTSSSSGNVVITDPDGNVVYSQAIDLASRGGYGIDLAQLGIESGRYNVAVPSSAWVWTGCAAEDYSGSGVVAPGIAVYYKTAEGSLGFSWGFAQLPANEGFATSGMWTFSTGAPWKAESVNQNFNSGWPYIQFKSTLATYTIDLKPYIQSVQEVSRAWRQVLYSGSVAGQAAFSVLVANNGAGANGESAEALYPPVDIVYPDYLQTYNMTAEELLIHYYAYLNKLNETFRDHTILDPNDINISTNSIDLLIRANVYNASGALIINASTPFTLYTTLDGLALVTGQTATMTSPGYIITWADGYDSLEEYIKATNVENRNVTYLSAGQGWTIEVKELAFEQKIVGNHTLEIDRLITYVPPELSDGVSAPPQGDDTGSSATWCLIVIIAGVVMAIIGFATDRNALAIVGVAVAVIAAAAWYLIENPIDLGPFCLAYTPSYLQKWWR
jgi:hypothetical protein